MGRALAAHDALVPSEYAPRVPASLRICARLLGRPNRKDAGLPPGVRLAKALEQMGPSAIKLGQFLATRPDILGSDVARGLETLQDRLPPFPEAEARLIVEAELGRPLGDNFAVFSRPVAAASIAQVHEAETTDIPPRHVAVKVLRPGIEVEFARDFEAFRFAAATAERFSSEARRLRLVALVETLARSVALELDLRMEGAAAAELAENMREDAEFRVPALDWSRTSARVSALARQEIIHGRRISTAETIEKIEAATADDLQRVAREFFRSETLSLGALGNLNGFRVDRSRLRI